MSTLLRSIKNVTKGYSTAQIKVRNATSNHSSGPSSSELEDIAVLTHTPSFFDVMDVLDMRLNDSGPEWRRVLKALDVLKYCLGKGSTRVAMWARDNIYIVEALREFQYIDKDGTDSGMQVRIAAREIVRLVLDKELSLKKRTAHERRSPATQSPAPPAGLPSPPLLAPSYNEENEQELLRLLIEASKNAAEEEQIRKDYDEDLQRALRLSKEESAPSPTGRHRRQPVDVLLSDGPAHDGRSVKLPDYQPKTPKGLVWHAGVPTQKTAQKSPDRTQDNATGVAEPYVPVIRDGKFVYKEREPRPLPPRTRDGKFFVKEEELLASFRLSDDEAMPAELATVHPDLPSPSRGSTNTPPSTSCLPWISESSPSLSIPVCGPPQISTSTGSQQTTTALTVLPPRDFTNRSWLLIDKPSEDYYAGNTQQEPVYDPFSNADYLGLSPAQQQQHQAERPSNPFLIQQQGPAYDPFSNADIWGLFPAQPQQQQAARPSNPFLIQPKLSGEGSSEDLLEDTRGLNDMDLLFPAQSSLGPKPLKSASVLTTALGPLPITPAPAPPEPAQQPPPPTLASSPAPPLPQSPVQSRKPSRTDALPAGGSGSGSGSGSPGKAEDRVRGNIASPRLEPRALTRASPSKNPNSDLIDHYKLETEFEADGCTIHISYKLNPANRRARQRAEKRWIRGRKIGGGGFSQVWLEKDGDGKELRAVKVVEKSIPVDYRRELLAMALLSKHESLFVKFLGWYEDQSNVYLAMEYFKHGDLAALIHSSVGLGEEDAKEIVEQVLEGLDVMASLDFIHRDLKPQNIFVFHKEPSIWVKIGDFGLSKRLIGDTVPQTRAYTENYAAPEVCVCRPADDGDGKNSSGYTDAVDIWSLGIITHEILTKHVPFYNYMQLVQYFEGRCDFPMRELQAKQISTAAVNFIKHLLAPFPGNRPTAKYCLEDVWLQRVSKETVFAQMDYAPGATYYPD